MKEYRNIVVTGASSGLGAALAEHLARPGCCLGLVGRDLARLEAVRMRCIARGAEAEVAIIDVREAARLGDWLIRRDTQAPIDLVVAAAGIGGADVLSDGLVEQGDLARTVVDVNLGGIINTVTPLLDIFVRRRSGSLVLVGSISGSIGLPQSPAYCASKAAVSVYGDALRRLVRPSGVTVLTVLPGFVDTPMSRSLGMRRPFCWPADKAVRRIMKDLRRGRGRSVFPWPLRLAIGLQILLPLRLTDSVLSRSVVREKLRRSDKPAAAPAQLGDGGGERI